jgi:hypothetical protein
LSIGRATLETWRKTIAMLEGDLNVRAIMRRGESGKIVLDWTS